MPGELKSALLHGYTSVNLDYRKVSTTNSIKSTSVYAGAQNNHQHQTRFSQNYFILDKVPNLILHQKDISEYYSIFNHLKLEEQKLTY